MTRRIRHLLFTPAAVGCVCLLAACGSSASKTVTAGPGASGTARPAGLKITTSEQACLKKHGVTFPSGGRRFGGGTAPTGSGGGNPPASAGGTHARHHFPKGGAGAGGFAKQRTALKACGVSASFHHPGGTSGPSAG